jgi:hypothetical protein
MPLVCAAVDFSSDIGNFVCNSKLRLLLLGCPFCNSRFPVIFAYFKKTDIIVDSIAMVRKCIVFSVGVISKAANCCLDIRSECLANQDKLAQASFGIGGLYFDREGKLLKQRCGIMRQCFVLFSEIPDVNIHRVFIGCSCNKEANIVLRLLKVLE